MAPNPRHPQRFTRVRTRNSTYVITPDGGAVRLADGAAFAVAQLITGTDGTRRLRLIATDGTLAFTSPVTGPVPTGLNAPPLLAA